MTFIVLLVVGLVILAGIIAFAGDRLGTYVGRRRLSLFGARPRRTGQLVGVMAGILIMLSTLGVLALAFQNATATLINFQRTLEELNRLQAQERVLNVQVNTANAQLADLRQALQEAQTTIATAEAARDEALSLRDAALAEQQELLEEQAALEAQVAQAGREIELAEDRLEMLTADLEASRTALDEANAALDQTRTDRDEAQAEAERFELEAGDARSRFEDVSAQLGQLQEQLRDAGVQLGLAEGQLVAARIELDAALAAREEAIALRDEALAAQAEALAIRDEALAERDAAVLDRDQAEAARDAASRQSQNLEARVQQLTQETSELEASAEELRLQATTLEEENAQLVDSNQRLAEFNASLEDQIRQRNAAVQDLQVIVSDLQVSVERQAGELRELQLAAGRFEGGDVYFVRDQLIYSGAIHAQDPAEVRQELAAFIADATTFVARRGVERVNVTPEQFSLLVDVISQTPESDLIRFISPSNQISSTIDVLVEAIENTMLFERGQLVSALPIHLGSQDLPSSQNDIRNSIAQLKAEAVRKMRRAGLDEGSLPDFGAVTEEMFTNMLLRLTGPATIALVATEPIHRAGPAHLELMILY